MKKLKVNQTAVLLIVADRIFFAIKKTSLIVGLILLGLLATVAQETPFDLEIYKDFVSANEDISPAELDELYPSDIFEATVPAYNFESVLFLDKMNQTYNLTTDEKTLLMNNGFMVTERLNKVSFSNLHAGSFFAQFINIYHKDLPVFVSTDAILHAFHLSYDEILKQIEINYLIPELKKLLDNAHYNLNDLNEKYGQLEAMKPMLNDVDVYLTVAKRLLGNPADAFYEDNNSDVSEYLNLIKAEKMESVYIFSEDTCRKIDFSQFKPRGHYEEQSNLQQYFRAMMWLGRMEFYLDHPDYNNDNAIRATVNRQIVDAILVNELFTMEENEVIWEEMEDIISFFVGEQDNVSPTSMKQLLQDCELNLASELLDENNINLFLNTLRKKSFAGQQILSQVFDGNHDGSTRPTPSSYMPFGQRFVIDSYVTGQVVYDRIIDNEDNICRLVPSTLDVMFALGNNAATQLLIPELREWRYSDNLAGLRYLIDQYDDKFWESSLYNLWLYAIKSLNPDPGNEELPEFMRTAAWGLEKMNTQLASWTELRHDNLLYAKQSYTSGDACSHPEGYVEPNPEFFGRMKRLAEIAENKFTIISEKISWDDNDSPVTYFKDLYAICNTLQNIANKELAHEELTDTECSFLDNISFKGGCFGPPTGWYAKLEYNAVEPGGANLVVADYHTTPTDCGGNLLGWVSHAGTGLPDVAIVVAPLASGELCAFAGPVASYHEYKTSNFQRLTDSEWKATYLDKSLRPEWVYGYLADESGKKKESSLKLFSDQESLLKALQTGIVSSVWIEPSEKATDVSISPNPVTQSTMITIRISEEMRNNNTHLMIYNIEGKLIKNLMDGPLPPGNYMTRWDRNDETGSRVPPGMYILRLVQGENSQSEKLLVAD